jgi:uncharacterized membrane protein
MNVFEKGLVTILAVDVVLALVAIPLVLRKVPRNVAYGYRTRKTLSDDFIWYEANAHFGRGLVVASVLSGVAVVILARSADLSPQSFLMATVAALALPSLVAILATARYIQKLKSGESARLTPR